ncbi:protein of unknown function DUF192 [Stanieria cyanosphaera PCC 7437]|uniref:ACR family protein n=1 Tax=Stanieria cyanosphaera (strain ATCC 29371 / PCC 7437) TaxID=111780 RepID=K9XNW3_STAC7|nr:DUF192 domain-containing protein [Stanieria cyanosphaera]AFZ33769.1 protein of unknown function DUF192 [Stanieria cyanosphaera PCC 7437]
MNRKNSWVVFLLIGVLFNSGAVILSSTLLATASASESQPQGQILPIAAKTNIKGQIIELEVAQTPEQQATGLMFRDSLPDNRGMLFSFDTPQVTSFWMKNVSISLDMIFLYQGKVKAIAANVPPCTTNPCPVYGPKTIIDQVIELRGGRAKELGLKVNDLVQIEFLAQSSEH